MKFTHEVRSAGAYLPYETVERWCLSSDLSSSPLCPSCPWWLKILQILVVSRYLNVNAEAPQWAFQCLVFFAGLFYTFFI
jgi:hypothetical protein